MRKCRPRPITSRAKYAPSRNSGTEVPRNRYVQRFSLAYSPGATKAQIWYSHTGEVMTTPTTKATLMRR